MSRTTVSPADLDLVSPGRRDYHVKFQHPTLWGHYLVPLTVMVGAEAKAGEGLVAIGSTHGNEYEGPVAIKHLMGEIDSADVRGRLVLIPVLNVAAFAAGVRDTPDDGVNLNRAFPGDAAGSLTYRFADLINTFVFPHVDIVFDMHAGGRVARFPIVASFHHVSDNVQRCRMEEAARGFGTPFVMIYKDDMVGLLTSAAERLGKITVGAELGWGQAVNATGISMARQGILTAAVRAGILAAEMPENTNCPTDKQVMIDTSDAACSLLAPFAGHYEPTVMLGDHVKCDELLGYIHDFNRIDMPATPLTAPHDGYVVCQAWETAVFKGQVVTQVGITCSWSNA